MRHLPSSFCGLNSSRASGWSSRIKLSMLRNATTKRNDEKLETSFFFARQQGEGSKTSMSCLLWRLHILPLPLPLPSIPLLLLLLLALSAVQSHALFHRSFLSFFSQQEHRHSSYLSCLVRCPLYTLLCFTLLYSALLYYTFASSKFSLSLELNIHVHPTDSRRVGSNTLRLT